MIKRNRSSWLLLPALAIVAGCGSSTGLLTSSEPSGRVDETRIFFSRFSSPIEPDGVTAQITFSIFGENLARGMVSTPAGQQFALIANDEGDLVETRVTGSRDRLSERFPDGEYTFTAVYKDGFARFLERSMSGVFPSFPEVVSPLDEEQISLTPVIEWFRVPQVDLYQVSVVKLPCVCEVFSMTVGGDASFMSLTIPEGDLEPDTRYRIEVRAVSPEGVKASATVLHVTTS